MVCEDHSDVRWIQVSCKERNCPICGPVGRSKIAERILAGVRMYWPCAWLVLTFDHDVEKKVAVRKLGAFVKWLRTRRGMSDAQYAATYELTAKGRLHINLLFGRWEWVPWPELLKRWGARLSVEMVQDEGAIGAEAAKSLGGYLSKLEQAVPEDRRVSFSKGWPPLPEHARRKGRIMCYPPSADNLEDFLGRLESGGMVEIAPGEYTYPGGGHSGCNCFQFEDS